jgi:predicted enzyme related to lactoylglutathione lyase
MAKVVHFEIPVDEPDRAIAFYREALGWDVSRFGDEGYWLVSAGVEDEPGADGALIRRGDLHRCPVVIVGVDDLDDALRRSADAGGAVLQAKLPVPGVGWSAYVRDSEGNAIGLFQADSAATDA